ncbi:MAG: hypothetical protein WCG55_00835 [bacterium]
MIEGEIHPLATPPKSKKIGRRLKQAVLVTAATVLPVALGKEKIPHNTSFGSEKIIERNAQFDTKAPRLVPIEELPRQIELSPDTLRTNDTNAPQQSAAIDTVRSDIQKTFTTHSEERAVPTSLEKKQIEVSVDTLERYIRDIVNEGLKNAEKEVKYDAKGKVIKKDVITTLHSLNITKQGDVLSCSALLKAKKGFFLTFDIKVKGELFNTDGGVALGNPDIHARTEGIARQAEEQIMPVWDTIMPMLGMRLAREHKAEGKSKTTVGGSGLKYEFATKKE